MKNTLLILTCLCVLFSCGSDDNSKDPEVIKVDKLKISDDSISLRIGDNKTLTYNILPIDANEELMFVWSSNDERIATVENGRYGGMVTAISVGKTTVKIADANNDKLFASCIVNVLPINISSIELSKNNMEMYIGDDSTLFANIKPSNATYKEIIWESSDETIATVENGIVHAINEGNVTIYAKSKDKIISGKCDIIVKSIKVSSVEINELKQLTEIVDGYDFHFGCKFMIGAELDLTYSAQPSEAHNKEVDISSSDESVVSIDHSNKLHANKAGISVVTITSKDGGASKTYNIIVGDITIFTIISMEGSINSFNGNSSGELYSTLRNTSDYNINITSFQFIDTKTNQALLSIGSDALGNLPAHSISQKFGGPFSNVYKPKFVWTYTYDGNTYQVVKQY